MRFRFRTINRTIPSHVSFIIPISNIRLKNLKLAVSRRIKALGYADRVKVIMRSYASAMLKEGKSCGDESAFAGLYET